MRRVVRPPWLLLFIPLVASFVGCAGQTPQAPTAPTAVLSSVSAASAGGLSSGTAAAKLTKPDVPFRGEVTGELTLTQGSAMCKPAYLGVSDATGQALHMGRITYHTEQCLKAGVIDGKVLVLTAANGDELRGTFGGTSTPSGNQFQVMANVTFTGGTGRFENATGTAAMTAVLTPTATPGLYSGRWKWTGRIRY
jgi:hypothetical protein